MIHVRLPDADRERLGCPEWLDLDPYGVTAREAAVLQRGFDVEGEKISFETPGHWRRALRGGAADGEPVKVAQFPALLVLVWLALRRAGVMVPASELDFDVDGTALRSDDDDPGPTPEPDASPGKDDEPAPPPSDSEQSTTSTP